MLNHLLQYGYVCYHQADENMAIHELIQQCIKQNVLYKQFIRVFSLDKGDEVNHNNIEVPFKYTSPIIQIDDRIFMPLLEYDNSIYIDEITGFVPPLSYVDIEI